MVKRLPLSDTTVSVNKSMMQIQFRLEQCGFDQTAQINNKGRYMVTAAFGGIECNFEVDTESIVEAMAKASSDRKKQDMRFKNERGVDALQKIREQAGRVGWRLMALHIKALCDSVELGVIDMAQAFAGNLVLEHKDGRRLTLGDRLKETVAKGELQSASMFKALQIGAPTK